MRTAPIAFVTGHPERVVHQPVDRDSRIDNRRDAADDPAHYTGKQQSGGRIPANAGAVDVGQVYLRRYSINV